MHKHIRIIANLMEIKNKTANLLLPILYVKQHDFFLHFTTTL